MSSPTFHRDAAPSGWKAKGWLGLARSLPSPNFDDRPAGTPVDLVVVHSISLPPGEYGGDAIERLFTNRLDAAAHPYFETIRDLRVSSHFLIRRDGALCQFVGCDARAWHAGRSTWQGRAACNDYSVGVELEGLEGGPFEAAQYSRLATLLKKVSGRYPIRSVAGHEHIAPGRKRDPGASFDWARLRRSMAGAALEFAA